MLRGTEEKLHALHLSETSHKRIALHSARDKREALDQARKNIVGTREAPVHRQERGDALLI